MWVCENEDAPPVFHPAAAPTLASIECVASRTCERVLKWLRRNKLLEETPVEQRSNEMPEEAALDACLRVAGTQGTFGVLLDPLASDDADPDGHHDAFDAHTRKRRTSKWAVSVESFNVHAGTTVASANRDALERLLRYGARPVLALDRLTRLPDGRFAYRMKYPIGIKTHRVMDPMELLARLAAVVAPPKFPLLRYHGVFAPSAKWRSKICPGRPARRKRCCPTHEQLVPPQNANAREALTADPVIERTSATPPSRGGGTRIEWALLLKHGLNLDALRCPRCSARMSVIAVVREPREIRRVLEHLGEPTDLGVPSRAWDPVAIDDWPDEPPSTEDWA